MDQNTIIALAACVVILIIGGVIALVLRSKKKHTQKLGKKGERKVTKILKKYARFNDVKILNDVYLPLYDETTQIDHILIAPFGVMVIETKNWAGSVYGNPAEEKWLQVLGDDRNYHYNPLKQNKTHTDNIRHLFRKENIYRVNVEGVVVFAAKTDLYCPRNAPVYTAKRFKKLLKKPVYGADNKVDVQKVYDAIVRNQVTDKKKIAEHEKNVKKKARAKS